MGGAQDESSTLEVCAARFRANIPYELPESYPGDSITTRELDSFVSTVFTIVNNMSISRIEYFCETITAGGDPHFSRWKQTHRDSL